MRFGEATRDQVKALLGSRREIGRATDNFTIQYEDGISLNFSDPGLTLNEVIVLPIGGKDQAGLKTDQGLALLDPATRVQELYGAPDAVWSTRYGGDILYFKNGMTVTLDRRTGDNTAPKIVVQMKVNKPFTPEQLQQSEFKHQYNYTK